MLLSEILNSTAEIKVVHDGPSPGRKHLFKTQADICGRSIEFLAYKNSDYNNWLIEFQEEGELELSGRGKEFEVFSMVKKSVEMLIEKHHPEQLKFAADKRDRSRSSLYEKFVKRYMKDWKCNKDESGSLVIFELTKK